MQHIDTDVCVFFFTFFSLFFVCFVFFAVRYNSIIIYHRDTSVRKPASFAGTRPRLCMHICLLWPKTYSFLLR